MRRSALLVLGAAACLLAPAPSPGAPADTTATAAFGRKDTTATAAFGREDTTATAAFGADDTTGLVIRADALRKRGAAAVDDLLRGRRPLHVSRLPSFQSGFGIPILLDAGGRVLPARRVIAADRATDRTVFASRSPFVGVPGLATAWDPPESRGQDAFDIAALDSSLAPGPFRDAGALHARPRPVLFTALAMPDPPAPRRVRSALLYRRGDGDLMDTGARFSSPFFARGVAASYVRHSAEGLPPFTGTLATRYVAGVGLTRPGPFQSWIEGRLFQMEIEAGYPGDPEFGTLPTRSRAEWASREAALHAAWRGEALQATGALRVGHGQATQVSDFGARERWRFPEIAAEAWLSRGAGADWSWSLGGEGSSRRVEYREGALHEFRPRIASGRVTAGLRRNLGAAGVAADVAADARDGDATLFDGRLSLWAAGERGRVRVDVESAHERPTFVDLFTPDRFDTSAFVLIVRRSGDPSLRARVLRGVLASGSFAAGRGVEIVAFGAVRRVTDDFGWTLRRTDAAGIVTIEDVAEARGDGWVAHAAGGGEAALGPLRVRGLAWIRGGPSGMSPSAGSPPRAGLDASVGLRASFFGGDLPLGLELEAHAEGPRRGLIDAPALATWDARLHADFGDAGVFARVTNLFDESVPSAAYEIEADRGAPLPGRALAVGAVWYLFD